MLRIRSFWVTRIRILFAQKDPCNLFAVKNCLNYSFVQTIFFIFDFKCHKMFRFGKKMPLFILLNIKNISKYDPDPDPVGSGLFESSGSGSVFLKPDPRIRMRKKWTGSATLLFILYINQHYGISVLFTLKQGLKGSDLSFRECISVAAGNQGSCNGIDL